MIVVWPENHQNLNNHGCTSETAQPRDAEKHPHLSNPAMPPANADREITNASLNNGAFQSAAEVRQATRRIDWPRFSAENTG